MYQDKKERPRLICLQSVSVIRLLVGRARPPQTFTPLTLQPCVVCSGHALGCSLHPRSPPIVLGFSGGGSRRPRLHPTPTKGKRGKEQKESKKQKGLCLAAFVAPLAVL